MNIRKSRKAVQKRIKLTGRGKMKRARAGRRHLMRKKSSKRRLFLKKAAYLNKVNEKAIKSML